MIFLDMGWIQNIYLPSTLKKKKREFLKDALKLKKTINQYREDIRLRKQEAMDESSEVLRQTPTVQQD